MNPPSAWLESAPLVIAHRGASLAAPENTLAAFEQALRMGADAIELDVKLTRDRQVVCFHDRTLARTTGAPGRPGAWTLAGLRSLDAGAWMSEAFRGERIPTLSEALELVGRRALVNIELTDYWANQCELVEEVTAVVRRHSAEPIVLLSSFQSSALVAAEQRAPGVPRAHLSGPTWLATRDRLALRRPTLQAVHPHETLASPERIASAHRAGRRVHVYTVDESDSMVRLWSLGIDGLITNAPDVALKTREAA
jgi:glycerophosphoryl diester phosphodiesterase